MNALLTALRRRPLLALAAAGIPLIGVLAWSWPESPPAPGPAGAPPARMTDPRYEEAAVRRFVWARSRPPAAPASPPAQR